MGTTSWEAVSRFMPTRTARQCRDRYKNYLVDDLVCDAWSPEEDALIVKKFQEIGPKWVEIAKLLNGRSGNHVKNRWHKHLSRIHAPTAGPPPQPRTVPRLEAQSAPVYVDQQPPVPPKIDRGRDAGAATFPRFPFIRHLF
jgi:hypothetical protein